jgi:hypothetical protein
MADVTDAEIERAAARGLRVAESQPRAVAAHFDRAGGRIVVELVNGCIYAFPAKLVQDLQDAGEEALARVEVDGAGFNLHWPELNVDLYVPALISGVFGTRAWMNRELARVAGQTRSHRKAAAARANGAKGGRPRSKAQS